MSNQRFPSVDALARQIALNVSEKAKVRGAREAIERGKSGEELGEGLVQVATRLASEYGEMTSKPLINMSGVILHTGLGRARMADEVADHVFEVAKGHSCLEFDVETGERGDRQDHVEWLLKELTGAEAAMVVNNCAGAVILVLSAVCKGGEVVLSRGQMVEIGGSFRIPDVIRESGCHLVECGCTNKTHLRDFESVTGEGTMAWMQCHRSNFAMTGFVSSPSAKDLAEGAHRHGALFIDDLGSGCLVDTTAYGLPKERTLSEAVADGADVVMASGDKLLGGPQAGIILGSKEVLSVVKKHPMARALRCDKMTIAALEATLRMYDEGREREIPVWKYAGRELEEVRRDALALAESYSDAVVEEGLTGLGGGSLPGAGVPTWRCGLAAKDLEGLHRDLRTQAGVIGRIEKGRLWLDPRSAEPEEVKVVVRYLSGARS